VLEIDDDASARVKVRKLITSSRPDAVITGSDRLAAIVYGVATELQLRIGRDLAVTGFDGSVAGDLLSPRLTSVAIPVKEIASRVIDRALRQVHQRPDQEPGEIVPFRLRIGRST
jgi:DNA-binding LacI/PurR family transcriptional regulator